MSTDTNLIAQFPTVQNSRVLDSLTKHKNITVSGAGNFSAKSFVVSDVLRFEKGIQKVLWVVNDVVEMEHVVRALQVWSDIDVFTHRIEKVDATNIRYAERDNMMERLEFSWLLGAASRGASNKKIIVATYADVLAELPDFDDVHERTIILEKDEKVDVNELFEALIANGYENSSDARLEKGTYYKSGEVLTIFPLCSDYPIRITIGFEEIEDIQVYDQDEKMDMGSIPKIEIIPAYYESSGKSIPDYFAKDILVIEDELDLLDEYYEEWNESFDQMYGKMYSLGFVTFNEDDEGHQHLHYLSMLKYRGAYDLVNDLRDKKADEWRVLVLSKDSTELRNILDENNFVYHADVDRIGDASGVFIVDMDKEIVVPQAFQNPEIKLALVTDREISSIKEEKKKHFNQKAAFDFVTSLKPNDFVVHANHGIGQYLGLEKRTIDEVTREYLKIGYAENDKLFVPIDQADKVNKYIGADEAPPRLTRLGSAEWNTITKKVQKETEAIAKELLALYAERKSSKGFKFKDDTDLQQQFEEAFPYEETPGQIKAINDVKADMERDVPMDRLVCGDVGFGKTEVAMRAAFKAAMSGKQTAFVSPITILADQHYRSFMKRLDGFDLRIDVLSRFRTASEQKEILKKLSRGEIDVIIGTHRLLQKDIAFKDLGLVIIDEEQRFGVKQKEKLKELKKEVHMLTLTATPIPRTLNFALNKLRDISTITTPPPGRLPIITEVRRYSQGLIREAIMREMNRGGQVYFLHNRVQTIDSVAEKLQKLVPEARFIVAHGKLGSSDL
ncbi:MAG TPA: CarD family transcriptional regulator, partial [Candidatus Gracilibacteria bacterium]|nr:CarD family transcriptional regulator [Candidatus Gracilibacteria bacterium]